MFKRACIQIIAVQIAMTMTACTQKETKQFISDFNQATSVDFNIPYIDSTKVLAGDNIQDRNAMEQQALNQILSQTQPKQASGDYLMTNITLMGALCNPQNNLGYYINPQVTQAQSTLTRENTLDLYKWIVCRKEPRGYSRAKADKPEIHNSEPSL